MSIGCANLTLSGQLRDRRWPLGGKPPGDSASGLRCGKQRRQASNAQIQNEKWYNKKRESCYFVEGEQVLLWAKNITTRRLLKKFDARYLGPFLVSKRIGKLAY
jgi:hypothetical protein